MKLWITLLLLISFLFTSTAPAYAAKPQPKPAAPAQPSKLLIYYGIPQGVNGLWNDEAAGKFLSAYDYLVLGAGLEETSHTFHASTQQVISVIRSNNPRSVVFGYIDLGVSTNNYSMETMKNKLAAWKAMGANGIFLDDAGYDFQVSRSRLNEMLQAIHDAGLSAFVNAWSAKDVMGNEVHATYNPAGQPTLMGPKDYYLLESFFVNTTSYADNGGYAVTAAWKKRGDEAVAYRKRLGVKMLAIDTADFSQLSEDKINTYFKMSETSAGIFSLDGYGLSASQYSADAANRDAVKQFPYMSNYFSYYDASAAYRVNTGMTQFERGTFVLHTESGNYWYTRK